MKKSCTCKQFLPCLWLLKHLNNKNVISKKKINTSQWGSVQINRAVDIAIELYVDHKTIECSHLDELYSSQK